MIDAIRTLREIQIMSELGAHPNLVKLHTVHIGKNNRDIYLVFELCEADLHTVIRSGVALPEQKPWIMYQIARAIYFLHSGNVLHRDMKPSNILCNQDCTVKVADFGISKVIKPRERQLMTDYVATRWYRPPEVLLGSPIYGKPVDVWGFGCVLVELYI
jgi:mitogen-activated protein kinase 15